MFTVSYRSEESGIASQELETMTDVVTFLEAGMQIKLTACNMVWLLTGIQLDVGNFRVWLTEDVFQGSLN